MLSVTESRFSNVNPIFEIVDKKYIYNGSVSKGLPYC